MEQLGAPGTSYIQEPVGGRGVTIFPRITGPDQQKKTGTLLFNEELLERYVE